MQRGFGYQNRRNAGFSPASLFAGGTVNGAWYDPSDSTTLFSDRAGTTPCGTPGGGSVVPVGLMLDKSQGLVLSANVLSASWTVSAGATASGSSVTLNSASDVFAYQDVMTSGLRYFVTFDYNITSGQTGLYVGSNGGSGDTILSLSGLSGTGTYSGYFRASNTTFIFRDNSGCVASFTNITLRVQQGNHAIAANDTTARPELRARVNLLTYSEDFGNAAWTKSGTAVNTAAGIAPDGTNTANKIYPTSTGAFRQVFRTLTTVAISYVATVYAKAAEKSVIAFVDFAGGAGAAWFNLSTGVASNVVGGYTASITSVGNGWYRCSLTGTAPAGLGYYAVFVADSAGSSNVTANGTDGVLLWGAQLTATNEFPANTYQRISDANTYDAVGFPRYLVANGTSSAMSTPGNVNLSGTDKVTVFAGVRKLSDAAFGMVAEFGNNAPAGSFWVLNGDGAVGPGPQWQFLSTGATTRAYATATATSPISNVFTGIGDINAPLSRLRLNGAQVANTTTTQGGGNYGTYPLFIGSRNNASFFFNGNIYSIIVVGSAVSAGQISATEQWVAGKTGITI